MARFTHPAVSSEGSSENGTWTVVGGTIDATGTVVPEDQPQFSSDPLFEGHYVVVANICNFAVDVDMDNITNFGSGQYFIDLPFTSQHNALFSSGCLHDENTGNQYAMLGHVVSGTNRMTLLSIASNGQHVPFDDKSPITLNILDSFHITGTYEIMH